MKAKLWTAEEKEFLNISFWDVNWWFLCKRLDRSKNSIKAQAYNMGLMRKQCRKWYDIEIDDLRGVYPWMRKYDLMKRFDRSWGEITRTANKNGIYRKEWKIPQEESREQHERS